MLLYFLACFSAEEQSEPVVEARPNEPLNLEDPVDNAKAFLKMRGSLDENEEVVFYWHGYIYNQESYDPFADPETSYYSSPLLAFEGFNIARFEKISDTEYQMLSREITIYKNLFGHVVNCFDNFNINVDPPQYVPVVHVQNDPVNFVLGGGTYKEMGDLIAWDMDMFLSYPSPLPIEEYEKYSASNTYQSVELFDFYSQRSDLEDPSMNSVPVHLTWVRHGQYLPWMQAGQKSGQLIYHAQGYKVEGGFDGLPEDLKSWTEANAPEYKHAPESAIYGPNVTSWRYMKSLLENQEYPETCP